MASSGRPGSRPLSAFFLLNSPDRVVTGRRVSAVMRSWSICDRPGRSGAAGGRALRATGVPSRWVLRRGGGANRDNSCPTIHARRLASFLTTLASLAMRSADPSRTSPLFLMCAAARAVTRSERHRGRTGCRAASTLCLGVSRQGGDPLPMRATRGGRVSHLTRNRAAHVKHNRLDIQRAW